LPDVNGNRIEFGETDAALPIAAPRTDIRMRIATFTPRVW
jgi:hypothetical protein